MTNFSAHIEAVATHYWGKPTSRRGTELRWGTHGSKSVDLRAGTFFDHEANEGGGLVDLVRAYEPSGFRSVADVLHEKFGINKRQQEASKPGRFLSRVYDYINEDGETAYQVLRYEPKTFRQRRPDGNGGWLYNMQGVEALPYNMAGLMLNTEKPVFIVEGEKCADKLIELGALATTSHGGAGNWKPELNRHFKGRDVIIIPDADDAGDKHAKTVIANLMGIAAKIRRVDLPNLSAKQDVYDWFNNGNSVDDMIELVRGSEEIKEAEPVEETPVDDISSDTFPMMSISDLRNMPPVEWMIDDLITSRGFSVLYGAPAVGKSFVAIDMALSVAYGREWQGKGVKQGAVLYIAGEGVGGLGKRVKAWQTFHGVAGEDAPLIVVPLAVQFREDEDVEKLIRTVDAVGVPIKCIVIDTVARSMVGMEENSSNEIGIFVAACDAVRNHAECAVMAIHHSGKDSSRGMRGSNALLGACDTSIMLKRTEDKITMTIEKQKDAEPLDDMTFALEKVALIDDSSAVVVPTDAAPNKPKLNKSDREALEALRKALIDQKVEKVRIETWEEYHRLNSLEVNKSTRSRARKRVQDSGCIGVDNGFVWINRDLDREVAHEKF